MPIYEYRCRLCEREFEELVSAAQADEPRSCAECGGTCERLFSRFAVRISGGSSRTSSSGKSCAGCTKSSCATC